MWLIIDDKRDLGCDVIARTPEAGKELLYRLDWECLCLDHDLGAKLDGYDLIKWAIAVKCVPPKVQIVSSNPPGRKNIAAALEGIGYVQSVQGQDGEWIKPLEEE